MESPLLRQNVAAAQAALCIIPGMKEPKAEDKVAKAEQKTEARL